MTTSLENTILQLLTPNNESLYQGFTSMQEAFKDPGIDIALCECMSTTQIPQVRQYCAVLLRKKTTRPKQWRHISVQVQQGIKQTVLEHFMKESEQSVLSAITELMATLAKHELPQKKWPELMQLLNVCVQSNNIKEKELGLYAMSIITASAGHHLKPYLKGLLCGFSKTLIDTSSIKIPFHTIECLTNLVTYVGTEEMNLLQTMIPSVLQVIKHLATADEEKACKAMEIFDALVESEVTVIVPHIKPLIGFCLELAGSQNLEPNIRVKALHIISWLTRLKRKTILKHKLIPSILSVLFPIMCQSAPDEADAFLDDELNDDDELSPSSGAGQVIDTMALHLPPEKLIPPLTHHIETALKSNNPQDRKAAYLALAVISEGCSEHIRHKCLPSYLQMICKGIREENHVVRSAALYCLGQFAENLQPDISKYASDLLPVLIDYLQQTCQVLKEDDESPPSLSKTFYAVETFCENLGDELLPYLDRLMEGLLSFLTTPKPIMTKELAISGIGSVATSAKDSFVPYFPRVIDSLKVFISEETEDNLTLKIQAIDTLSIIAKTVGPEVFMPMAHDCMILGMKLVDRIDDPDLRRCVYNLFSSVSSVLKSEMSQYLETIVNHMLSTIVSCEGISAQYNKEGSPTFTLFDDFDLDDDGSEDIGDIDTSEELDEEEDIAGFTVENAYMTEKEAACCALGEISSNVGLAFMPFLERSFNEVKKLTESPACEVRHEAITCLGQFCITLNQTFLQTGSLEYRLDLELKQNFFLPKLFTTAREDTERRVVLSCLETLQEMLEKIKGNFVFNNTLESVVVLIKDVFKHKLACQDDYEDEELDDQEAEYDSMLFEYAGDIIPALVKIVPWAQFAPYFAGLLPFILSKTKHTCSESDKSFSIGTLAEVVAGMEPGASTPFLTHLLPIFLKGMTDNDDEIRSNSVYGLGVLVQNASSALFDQYPHLLASLSNMVSKETNPRARDNLCSTIAKMIITNTAAVPLREVFPALLQRLPLQVDMDENIIVYQCLAHVYSLRCEEFFQNFPTILKILSEVLIHQKVDDATGVVIVSLLKSIHADFPNDFESILHTLPPEFVETLQRALAHTSIGELFVKMNLHDVQMY